MKKVKNFGIKTEIFIFSKWEELEGGARNRVGDMGWEIWGIPYRVAKNGGGKGRGGFKSLPTHA